MTLTHSPAQVVQYYLAAQGVAVVAPAAGPWKVYRDNEPDMPDQVITIYDTSPVLEGRDMRSNEVIEHPGIAVRVRAVTSDPAKTKAREVKAKLTALKRTQVTVAGVVYLVKAFTLTTGVIPLGEQDKNNRVLYTLNGTLTLAELPPP